MEYKYFNKNAGSIQRFKWETEIVSPKQIVTVQTSDVGIGLILYRRSAFSQAVFMTVSLSNPLDPADGIHYISQVKGEELRLPRLGTGAR
mgnify:CR=1 FL=1